MFGYIQKFVTTYIERNKKEVIKIFKSFGLSIAVTSNVTVANYLDVNFDLTTDIYKPYRKPNGGLVHINIHSNHPPQTLYGKFHYQ